MTTGYGVDMYCLDSWQTGRLVSGAVLVGHALFRRLTTPRGTLRGGAEESIYGLDLTEFVGAQSDRLVMATLPDRIRAECLKDDRVSSVTASVFVTTPSANDPSVRTLEVTLDCILSDSGESFSLTLGVSDAGAELLRGLET